MTAAGRPSSRFGLYLDLQIAQVPLYIERGTVRYCTDYTRALLRHEGMVRGISLNPMMPFPAGLPLDLLAHPRLQWSTATNLAQAEAEGPVAYHVLTPFMLSQFDSLVPAHTRRPHIPLVMTLTDVFPVSHPDEFFSRRDVARRLRVRAGLIRSADLVLTISEATRREAIRWLELDPERVVTVGTGVSAYFRPPADREASLSQVRAALPAITRPFVMCVTGPWPRKNTERLIEAFAQLPAVLRNTHQLVLVCRLTDECRTGWADHARVCGLRGDQVILTDLVSEPVLRALYQSARLFVYPPLLEGFGLPAAEAAACGCATICSNTSSMPEVLDFAPATFAPDKPAQMAEVMRRGLEDESFRAELLEAAARSAATHTWDHVVDRTAGALARLGRPGVEWPRASAVRRRPRLALVGGPPRLAHPDPAASTELLRRLAVQCDLDLFYPGRDRDGLPSHPGMRRFPSAALGRLFNPAGYDAVIYSFDQNDLDATRVSNDLALLFPGIVWLQPSRSDQPWLSASSLVLKLARGVLASSPEQLVAVRAQAGPLSDPPPGRLVTKSSDVVQLVRVLQRPATPATVQSAASGGPPVPPG